MSRVSAYPRRPARAAAGIDFELLLAEGAWARTVGLLAERGLDAGVGLLIPRCSSVHTIGMRFPMDVAFVRLRPDGEPLDVLSVTADLRPWRTAGLRCRGTGLHRREIAAVELAAGEAARLGIAIGEPIATAPTPP